MTKKTPPKKPESAPLEERFKGVTGAKSTKLNMELINQAVGSLWFPENLSKEAKVTRVAGAIELLEAIKPADEIESMLATQMIGAHSAAMECLRRAMLPNQTVEGRDQNLKHAAKLLSIYTSQMDALNKNRGKGQQKVTVEHINVEAGAQAVVGNVQTHSGPGASAAKTVPALAHTPGTTLDLKATKCAPVEQRIKSARHNGSKI